MVHYASARNRRLIAVHSSGDKDHEAIDPTRPNWDKAIAVRLRDQVKPSLQKYVSLNKQENFAFAGDGRTPAQVHDEAMSLLEEMHRLPAHYVEERRSLYNQIQANPAFRRLCLAFDTWCALWFWPADRLQTAPLATQFVEPDQASIQEVQRIRASGSMYNFFHWELEFPDVFGSGRRGFDAVVGNPPWEIQKPNSKEFFSNIDPLYRGYGKTEAEAKQKEFFRAEPRVEHDWLAERARLKALLNWSKNAGRPFGDYTRTKQNGEEEWVFNIGSGFQDTAKLHRDWRRLRAGRLGYADPAHPFQHQGAADLNTYKLFLEAAYRLLRDDGRLGFLVPSGIYSDQGSTNLRTLFLERSQWEWLFGFENREKVFDIDSRFKFATVIVQKGGATHAIRTAFMHRSLADWEDAEEYALEYSRDRVHRYSPLSKALVEVRSEPDFAILERLYDSAALLGAPKEGAWRVRPKREFHMTDDAKKRRFRGREKFEADGYIADEYGHWLKGEWSVYAGPGAISDRHPDLVVSADGGKCINLEDIDDVALPFYEGRMIGQFDFSEKGWISGKGRSAKWEQYPFSAKQMKPQFCMSLPVYVTTVDREGKQKAVRGYQGCVYGRDRVNQCAHSYSECNSGLSVRSYGGSLCQC